MVLSLSFHENYIFENSLKEKSEKIADSIRIETTEIIPSEAVELQQQVLKLKQLNDPDFNSTIRIKEQKLESLIKSSELEVALDAGRREILRDVTASDGFWEITTREELTAIFQELVEEVLCSVKGAGRMHLFSARLKI